MALITAFAGIPDPRRGMRNGLLPVLWTGVPANQIVEALDVVELVRPGVISSAVRRPADQLRLSDEKKLSSAILCDGSCQED